MTEAERMPVEDPALAATDLDRVVDAQVDIIDCLRRHPLSLDGDVALLSAAIGYIAHAHRIDPDTLAFRAASPRGNRTLH